MADFAIGANPPWIDHGLDLGSNAWPPGGSLSDALAEIPAAGLGLEELDRLSAPARPVDEVRLDAPVLRGELPNRGRSVAPDTLLATARAAGYAGALAWWARAGDRFSHAAASHAALAAPGQGWNPTRPEIS